MEDVLFIFYFSRIQEIEELQEHEGVEDYCEMPGGSFFLGVLVIVGILAVVRSQSAAVNIEPAGPFSPVLGVIFELCLIFLAQQAHVILPV